MRARGFCAEFQEECVTGVIGSSLNARNNTTQKNSGYPSLAARVGKKNRGTGCRGGQSKVNLGRIQARKGPS